MRRLIVRGAIVLTALLPVFAHADTVVLQQNVGSQTSPYGHIEVHYTSATGFNLQITGWQWLVNSFATSLGSGTESGGLQTYTSTNCTTGLTQDISTGLTQDGIPTSQTGYAYTIHHSAITIGATEKCIVIYSNGLTSGGSPVFNYYLDSATSRPVSFVYGTGGESWAISTTTTDTALLDLINNVNQQQSCSTASSTLAYAFCSVLVYVFSPPAETVVQYSDLWQTVWRKPPFGYYFALQGAFSGLSTTTAATSSSPALYAVAGSATTIFGGFFVPIRYDFAIVFYLLLAAYILYRITHFDFHA